MSRGGDGQPMVRGTAPDASAEYTVDLVPRDEMVISATVAHVGTVALASCTAPGVRSLSRPRGSTPVLALSDLHKRVLEKAPNYIWDDGRSGAVCVRSGPSLRRRGGIRLYRSLTQSCFRPSATKRSRKSPSATCCAAGRKSMRHDLAKGNRYRTAPAAAPGLSAAIGDSERSAAHWPAAIAGRASRSMPTTFPNGCCWSSGRRWPG